ncbi:ISL3 family transposase [Undibacterium sp. CCC3.4]|uniref:ISL3 family transposase n=1 Tax=Undibacterium sp. CCC3.4 TaxID=3048609 RepID=UPI002AC9CDC7|nr:ISL3 family transposase [Undibacterium sp. CCC3.4]WPX45649.1 ISL3 family transposase [Undibacterium sp. CCC3.4]
MAQRRRNPRPFGRGGCQERLPDVNAKRLMTSRLVDWIGQQAVKRTFTSLADEVGIVEGTVRLIFKDYVSDLEQKVRFETPRWMGIDEIQLTQYRCVITNVENNTVVDLLHNRNKETVVKYLSQLQGREKIQYVAMDMWVPYKDAVNLVLPESIVVIDKFYVVRMANDAMEKIRKSLRESLTTKQRRGLMHDRFVLLKRESDLTDQEAMKLSGWAENYPELGLAYRLKEDFFKIYDSQSKEEALARYAAWEISVTEEVRDAFSDLIKAWRNWQPHILAYFDHRITNAHTESVNSLMRVMVRLGRGYSFEALRAKLLFSEGAHKKSQKRPAFERRAPVSRPSLGRHMVGFTSLVSANNDQNLTDNESEESINYGVDIAMLTRMIEDGEI